MTDHYQTLGIDKTATLDEIKTAYRKAALEHHPDRNPGDDSAATKFQAATDAYNILKDPKRRADYDAGFDGYGGFRFTSEGGFHDIFETMGFPGGFRRAPPKNHDLSVTYAITLENALNGVDVAINFHAPDGTPRDVAVKIPPGVDNGSRLRVVGMGDRSHKNLPPGNLFIAIRVQPHPTFLRAGHDLIIERRIDAVDAMLGTTLDIPTLEGGTVRVTVPPGTQFGDRLRVQGKGVTKPNETVRGDLYVALGVTVARDLTPDQITKLREFKSLQFDENPSK